MAYFALVAWILTAVAGGYLLVRWLAAGGLRRQPTKVTRFPSALVLSHPLMAVTGLGLWVVYLTTARAGFAWGAFGLLVAVAMLGFVMFTRWLVGRGGRHARGVEQHFPGLAVMAHGLVAMLTFALVFAASILANR